MINQEQLAIKILQIKSAMRNLRSPEASLTAGLGVLATVVGATLPAIALGVATLYYLERQD